MTHQSSPLLNLVSLNLFNGNLDKKETDCRTEDKDKAAQKGEQSPGDLETYLESIREPLA